jgi:hypothetical protein
MATTIDCSNNKIQYHLSKIAYHVKKIGIKNVDPDSRLLAIEILDLWEFLEDEETEVVIEEPTLELAAPLLLDYSTDSGVDVDVLEAV